MGRKPKGQTVIPPFMREANIDKVSGAIEKTDRHGKIKGLPTDCSSDKCEVIQMRY